jgi:hypothetical protein
MITYSHSIWLILITAVLSFVLGWAWYSPVLFGKPWTRLMKFTPEHMEAAKKKGMAKPIIISFISSLVTVSVFFSLADTLVALSLSGLLMLAVLIWLAFEVPFFLNAALWEGRDWTLFWIGATQQLAGLVLASLIYSFWR